MNPLVRYLSPIAIVITLGGCGFQESVENAGAEINAFHADLDAGQIDRIWNSADPQFRQMATKPQFEELLSSIRKLGKVTDSKQSGWKANSSTSGSFVTVTMQTTFEKGQAVEEFVYRKGQGGRLALLGYHIQRQREPFK